jgi:hypothetical protein
MPLVLRRREFADIGLSGKSSERPAFQAMFQTSIRCAAVLGIGPTVTRRLLRNPATPATTDIVWRGLAIIYGAVLGQHRRISRCSLSILAAVAKQERVRLSERTKAGLARVRAKGKPLGRPTIAVDLAGVRLRINRGESLRAISRDLGISAAVISSRLSASA